MGRSPIRLFKPLQLRGKYVWDVLESRHLAAGPMVERLRHRLAEEFHWWKPEQIVLACSASELFRAFCMVYGDPEIEGTCFPLFRQPINPGVSDPPLLVTDIGGQTWQQVFGDRKLSPLRRWLFDTCHGWDPTPKVRWNLCSFAPTKLYGAAGGGVMFCAYEEEAAQLRRVLNYGFETNVAEGRTRDWETWHPPALRGEMSDVQAALALEALERGPNDARPHRITRWRPKLPWREGFHLLQLPFEAEWQHVQALARGMGVAIGRHFPPEKLVTLPAWEGMTISEQIRVAELGEAICAS